MPAQKQKDNSTFIQKKHLRKRALEALTKLGVSAPAVMETHGGTGQLYRACYRDLGQGVVMEKDGKKIAKLALQRPTWAVYQCECERALQEGLGGHLAVNLLDCDPYGDANPTLDAFFSSQRPFAPVMAVVVNDGLRQTLGVGAAWSVRSMRSMVEKYGNDLHPIYLEVCKELLKDYSSKVGYEIKWFAGYYCGANSAITHWLAVLTQTA